MNWKELLIYGLFIAVVIFVCFHFMARREFSTTLRLTADEQVYLTKELKRRCADDCVLTRTFYGFRCEELKTGKVFKIKM
jgi:hypothetical protein